MPPETAMLLQRARQAVEDERTERGDGACRRGARAVAGAAEARAPGGARAIGWSHLLLGDAKRAGEAVAQARKHGEPDPALVGAVHLALGDLKQARKALEAARGSRRRLPGRRSRASLIRGARGPGRGWRGPAAVALDIVEQLSRTTRDGWRDRVRARRVRLVGGTYDGDLPPCGPGQGRVRRGARERQGRQPRGAIELLRRAVEAGFSDPGAGVVGLGGSRRSGARRSRRCCRAR